MFYSVLSGGDSSVADPSGMQHDRRRMAECTSIKTIRIGWTSVSNRDYDGLHVGCSSEERQLESRIEIGRLHEASIKDFPPLPQEVRFLVSMESGHQA
jgi:hypothetical protein